MHLPGVALVIMQKLNENLRCLYLNSPPMIAGMRSYLAAAGVDLSAEVSRGALVLSSDDGHLVNGRFDVEKMLGLLSQAIDQAVVDGYSGLWAAGDMTWEFGPEKNFAKLEDYERRLDELFTKRPELQGVCQYHAELLPDDAVNTALQTHRACYINTTLSRMSPYYREPGRRRAQITRENWLPMLAAAND